MKKILIYLLLIANLSLGLAYAWDIHPEAVAGYDLASTELVAGSDHAHPDGEPYDNHCGHGSAHLVGLVFSHTTPLVQSSSGHFFLFFKIPRSLHIAPLLRPPIA